MKTVFNCLQQNLNYRWIWFFTNSPPCQSFSQQILLPGSVWWKPAYELYASRHIWHRHRLAHSRTLFPPFWLAMLPPAQLHKFAFLEPLFPSPPHPNPWPRTPAFLFPSAQPPGTNVKCDFGDTCRYPHNLCHLQPECGNTAPLLHAEVSAFALSHPLQQPEVEFTSVSVSYSHLSCGKSFLALMLPTSHYLKISSSTMLQVAISHFLHQPLSSLTSFLVEYFMFSHLLSQLARHLFQHVSLVCVQRELVEKLINSHHNLHSSSSST